jgi:hypothetical protein
MTDPSQAPGWLSKRACLAMIACDVVIAIVVFIVKIAQHDFSFGYATLLVTYRFGVVRRGLVGQLLALVHEHLAVTAVHVLGMALILIAIAVFVLVFRSIFGFSKESLPLFALTFGSPFWFKNFVFTIGTFDVFGCIVALIALLLPVNAIYLTIVSALCLTLLFVHHIHVLLYIPTIGLIVLLRQRAAGKWNRHFLVQAAVYALAIGAVFAFLAFVLRPPVSPEVFLQALRDRALDPLDAEVLRMWYETIGQEYQRTMLAPVRNLVRIPIFAVLILLHAPLIAYFADLMRGLANRADRLFVVAGLVAVTVGHVVICVVVFDYSRWISAWAVCMMLVMFAVRLLPAREPSAVAITPRNAMLAWILTLIPRVGVTKPF